MAYIEDIIPAGKWLDHEIKLNGRYGAKGEKRAKRKKATPEQIKKQNRYNRTKRLTRLIRANFEEGDYFITIKYKRGTKPTIEEHRKNFEKFRKALRRKYGDTPMKYIYSMEIGKRGGAHIHMILNKADVTLKDIQDCWPHGRINAQTLYEEGGYVQLAEYMTKEPEWADNRQLSLLEHGKQMWAFNTSRNLIRPKAERKNFKRRTIEKMIRDGIKPKDGYVVIPESIRYGINPFNGSTYLHYTEVEAGQDKGKRQKVPQFGECEIAPAR